MTWPLDIIFPGYSMVAHAVTDALDEVTGVAKQRRTDIKTIDAVMKDGVITKPEARVMHRIFLRADDDTLEYMQAQTKGLAPLQPAPPSPAAIARYAKMTPSALHELRRQNEDVIASIVLPLIPDGAADPLVPTYTVSGCEQGSDRCEVKKAFSFDGRLSDTEARKVEQAEDDVAAINAALGYSSLEEENAALRAKILSLSREPVEDATP